MAKVKKLSVLLGLREKVESTFKNMSDDMFEKFKNKGGLFRGQRKTFVAFDGFIDDETKKGYTAVASTVAEQLEWFKTHSADFFRTVLSIERTNAYGAVKANLIVDGEDWGEYSSLELLRLKSILDSALRKIIGQLPVRNEAVRWFPTTEDFYTGRSILETELLQGRTKTSVKESYIITDPHYTPDAKTSRPPQVADKTTQVETGKYTVQDFSGETSIRERAEMLVKLDTVYKAVVEALENANDAEVIESDLGDKLLNYLF